MKALFQFDQLSVRAGCTPLKYRASRESVAISAVRVAASRGAPTFESISKGRPWHDLLAKSGGRTF
jgi:hypothetical protein